MTDNKVISGNFEWDANKAKENKKKHKIDLFHAVQAFYDSERIIATDENHSLFEERFFAWDL